MKAVETVRTAFPLTSAVLTASPPSAVAPSATRATAASHGTRAVASNQHEKAAEAAEAAAATTADSTAIVGAIDTVQIGRGDTSAFKNEDDFAEKVKTFDQEGTPAVISGRASFSDITISDEETVSFMQKTKKNRQITASIFFRRPIT